MAEQAFLTALWVVVLLVFGLPVAWFVLRFTLVCVAMVGAGLAPAVVDAVSKLGDVATRLGYRVTGSRMEDLDTEREAGHGETQDA